MRMSTGAVLLLAYVVLLPGAFSGCKPGGDGGGEGGEGKAHVMTTLSRRQVSPDIPPQAAALIEREFTGMDLDVAAGETTEVYLRPGSGGGEGDGLVLSEAVFTARTPGRGTTRLAGPNAVVDSANKRIVFDSGVTVRGPGGNLLEAENLTWYYTSDVLEVDGPFTLTNGRGITTGAGCTTDVGFRKVVLD